MMKGMLMDEGKQMKVLPLVWVVVRRGGASSGVPLTMVQRGPSPRPSVEREIFAKDLVILIHDQVPRTTPQLEPTSPNTPTTLTRGRLCIDPSAWRVFSGTRLELVTCQPRVHTLDH
ncbi:hypothetical protein TNCV_1966701 [Trichonephila clavipes]|nr:hypothetical protein TNCV_1966701 [Trichonephila clavipes]